MKIISTIDKKKLSLNFNSFLKEEEEILQKSEAVALKRVLAYVLEKNESRLYFN